MKTSVFHEGVVFLAINFFAPIAYGLIFTAVPREIVFYVSILVFVLFQVLNFLRIRKGKDLKRCYVSIIVLNVMTLVAIGNVAFVSSLPTIWDILTNLP